MLLRSIKRSLLIELMKENSENFVFISYARENAESAWLIYRSLKDAGYTPWMDEFDLLPGQ